MISKVFLSTLANTYYINKIINIEPQKNATKCLIIIKPYT